MRISASTLPLLLTALWAGPLLARAPEDAPRLPPPTGKIVRVADVRQLYQALGKLTSETTILLEKGVYQLDKPVHVAGEGLRDIAIRGATGRWEDVVLRGAGMGDRAVYHGVLADSVQGLLVADVTIGWVGYHPVALQPKCKDVRIYHCRLVDAGEQFIKASSDGKGSGVDDGIVEYCVMEYTDFGPEDGYTNGVDVHGGKRWRIRHNRFRNIRTPRGARYKHVPAVLMWNGAADTICEANTFINCDRGIAFGLTQRDQFPDHRGGVIRNNFVYVAGNEVPHADAGICVAGPETKVLHNTVLLSGGYPNAIEVRWALSQDVVVANNLVDGRIAPRDGAVIEQQGNVTSAGRFQFKDRSAGDLHLQSFAASLYAEPRQDCPRDWDGEARDKRRVTVGADEQR